MASIGSFKLNIVLNFIRLFLSCIFLFDGNLSFSQFPFFPLLMYGDNNKLVGQN